MLRYFQDFVKKRLLDIQVALGQRQGNGYKLLSEYILNINMFRSVEDILLEAAKGIKEIINYDFFGFALEKAGRVTAWHNAHTDEHMFMNKLRNDFPGQKIDSAFCLLSNTGHKISVRQGLCAGLFSCSTGGYASGQGRLYVMPAGVRLPYHTDVLRLMTRTLTNAIQNVMTIEELKNIAVMDPLTECYNRTALTGYLEHSVATARRYGSDLSLIIFDIDRFKEINDRYGHQTGDGVLKEIAETVLSEIRKSDCLARYGGDEFILLLPNTNLFVAVALAERLRKKIANLRIDTSEGGISITASFGVSSLREGADGSAMLREADEMLYRSKARGRNRVTPHAMIQHRQPTEVRLAL